MKGRNALEMEEGVKTFDSGRQNFPPFRKEGESGKADWGREIILLFGKPFDRSEERMA